MTESRLFSFAGRVTCHLSLLLALLMPAVASAQTPDAVEDTNAEEADDLIVEETETGLEEGEATTTGGFDEYSEQSFKALVLNRGVSSTLPAMLTQKIAGQMEEKRFDNRSWSITESDVVDWCVEATGEAQIVRGDVDPETQQANITAEAVINRCSPVYEYTYGINHVCQKKSYKKKKKTVTVAECTVTTELKLWRYLVQLTENGSPEFYLDTKFKTDGLHTIADSTTSSSEITSKNPFAAAKLSALSSATTVAGLAVKRKIRNVRDFQLHAPIVAKKSYNAMFCLGQDTVALDTPFNVVVNTPKGEKVVGFVKAREIFDGCVETPKLAEESKKRKINLRPLISQIIIGQSRIEPAMTAWELPAIGLNFGGGVALTPQYGGSYGAGVEFLGEYNFGAHIGISELHAFMRGRLTFVTDTGDMQSAFLDAYPGLGAELMDSALGMQVDLGALKRFYVMGPLFIDAGAGLAFSYYKLGEMNDYEFGLYSIGGMGMGGLGWQIAPRWLCRVVAAYRIQMAKPSITDPDGESLSAEGDAGMDNGFLGTIDLLYTF